MKFLNYFALLLFSTSIFAQKSFYPTATIADSLRQNANAVVRLHEVNIEISSQRSMKIKTKRVVTVFNEKGQSALDAMDFYDNKSSINHIDAMVYNGFGTEIKNLKRKDFKDYSNYDGFTMLSDTRIVALEYTPTEYPFTMVFECEKSTSNTAFIQNWMPITEYYLGVEKAKLTVSFPTDLGFKKKEINFEEFSIKKITDTNSKIEYQANNLTALKPEDLTPESGVLPKLMMGLEVFNLEGVDGTVKNWKEYGLWFADKILKDTDELSEETVKKIKQLVGNETDAIKKAKIVYKFVQGKTRYISVQVGIGGFKPMNSKDVDRLGYGDCKALSNYTKALLNAVDVTSYYTELFGDRRKLDIDPNFTSTQGNHVILCVPNKDKNIFLECTSQDNPFGYQANFTDDRNVLIIKPEGGEIVKTTIYPDKDNTQISKGKYEIDENGNITGLISIISEGVQYGKKLRLEKLQPDEKDKHYKNYWNNISNLKLINTEFKNDKDFISFDEKVSISAENYGKINANEMLVPINLYNHYEANLSRVRNRKTPFETARGFYDVDDIEVVIPKGYSVTFIPEKLEISNKYCEYKTEIIKKDFNNLIYKRSLLLKSGVFPKTEYETFRQLIDQIERNDNAKIILTKNQ